MVLLDERGPHLPWLLVGVSFFRYDWNKNFWRLHRRMSYSRFVISMELFLWDFQVPFPLVHS